MVGILGSEYNFNSLTGICETTIRRFANARSSAFLPEQHSNVSDIEGEPAGLRLEFMGALVEIFKRFSE